MSEPRVRVLFIPQWYPRLSQGPSISGVFVKEHVRAAAKYDDIAVLSFEMTKQRWPFMSLQASHEGKIHTTYATTGRSFVPYTSPIIFRRQLRTAIEFVFDFWGYPDVIHTQDAYAEPVMHVTRDLGIPIVVSQHWTGFLRREVSEHQVIAWRKVFDTAVRILPANCEADVDYVHYGLKGSVRWLPNALDIDIFNLENAPPKRPPWLLHASGMTPQKRVEDIIEAFALVLSIWPTSVLHFAGDGVGRINAEALATAKLPQKNFCFHGILPKSELANLMRSCRGFVFPSDAETFGCVLMEAMACGCPVLTTHVGGIPCVVRPDHDEGIFVDVGDIEAISNGMLSLLEMSHDIDTRFISKTTQERFCYDTVGRILHEEHLFAAGFSGD